MKDKWRFFNPREDFEFARWAYAGWLIGVIYSIAAQASSNLWLFQAGIFFGMTVMFFCVLGPIGRYFRWKIQEREIEAANRRAYERASFWKQQ